MEHRRVSLRTFGAYLPQKRVLSPELDRAMGFEEGTCERSSGVAARHYSDMRDETQSRMAARAVRAALDSAGLGLGDLDALVNTSGTGEQEVPSNAALTMAALEAHEHPMAAFDINATCMSFLAGLEMVSYPVHYGAYRRVALVSSEIASMGLNPDNLETRPLFGDGACAAIVERSADGSGSRILASRMEIHPRGVSHCEVIGGRSRLPPRNYVGNESKFYFSMQGKQAVRMAAEVAPGFLQGVLDGAGVRLAEIDLIVPHQASRVGMEVLRRRLGASEEQWMWNLSQYGNMISASIPLAIHCAVEQGRISRGKKILLLGAAAGFGICAILMEY